MTTTGEQALEVVGVVEGERGEVVGGWVQLETRRSAGDVITVRTDDDQRIDVVISEAELPVEKLTGTLEELERHPAWKWCADDAPAPGVEVTMRFALVCGGDRIAAWGRVEATRLISRDGEAEGLFRGGAEAIPSRIAARGVALGLDAKRQLASLRTRDDEQRAKRAAEAQRNRERKAARRAAHRAAAEPLEPPVKRAKKTALDDRQALGYTLLAFAVAGVGALVVPTARSTTLAFIAGACWIPLAKDQLVLPQFHGFKLAEPRREAAAVTTLFAVVAAFIATCIVWSKRHAPQPDDDVGTFELATLAVVGAAVGGGIATWLSGRRRHHRLTLMDRGPVLEPREDGVWGATDGIVALGDHGVELGDARVATGDGSYYRQVGYGKHPTFSTTPLSMSASRFTIGETPVRTAGGAWLSMIHVNERSTSSRRGFFADAIPDGASVRVCGRAKNGEIAKGGQDSLLVFATHGDRPAEDVLRSFMWRLRWGRVLAVVGSIGWLVLAVVRTTR